MSAPTIENRTSSHQASASGVTTKPDGMDLRAAGIAWDLAKKALDKGDIQEAERLLEFMVESDVRLMLRKVEAKRELLSKSAI